MPIPAKEATSDPSSTGFSRPPLSVVGTHPPSAIRLGRPRILAKRACTSSGATKPTPASIAKRPCLVSASSMFTKDRGVLPARPSGSKPASPGTLRAKRRYAGSGRKGTARSCVSCDRDSRSGSTVTDSGLEAALGWEPASASGTACSRAAAASPAGCEPLAHAVRTGRWDAAAAARVRRTPRGAAARTAQPTAAKPTVADGSWGLDAAGRLLASATTTGRCLAGWRAGATSARCAGAVARKAAAMMPGWVYQCSHLSCGRA
mmetsp:Transcript_51246/g.164066  ORF Transcript_51246/g.164066 Transcript_51246/m.164066 type:complete len:262 (+) Transcript_51246:167-952(+)